ncbi:hypothetical protein, partial [uncultured Rikenella sp.]|uniref:hypothetical protein n=1 Tax=uncultured Rikenella sp. TaxID=368003 RepID=UPI002615DBB5
PTTCSLRLVSLGCDFQARRVGFSPIISAPAENPAQPIGQTRPEHPAGMRSEVFLVLFVHKKNSSIQGNEHKVQKIDRF